MKLSLGIVGLPNVGKSTLFNALTKQTIPAENYPFCTIDPNVGIVPVNDERLYKIAEIAEPKKITPAVVEFVDIAGLVKGAADGEGLGNQFLSHIREVSAIVHIVRAYENQNVTHVEDSVDPARDIELLNTELVLKDMETVAKRVEGMKGKARTDKDYEQIKNYLEILLSHLEEGNLANEFPHSSDEILERSRQELFLLTDKPMIYLLNVEDDRADTARKNIEKVVNNKLVLSMDIKQEADLAEMKDEERGEFMKELQMKQTGLEMLTREAYSLLGLISFFTEGPEEVRAWTISKGDSAPKAGATIHTDFEKKFIAAEVCSYEDYVKNIGWNSSKEVGAVKLQGREYVVKDGDIVLFKHGA